jgi:hypothetical protein
MKLPDNWPKKKEKVFIEKEFKMENGLIGKSSNWETFDEYNQAIDDCTNALGEVVEAERERIIEKIAPFMSNRPLDDDDLQKLYPDQIRKFLTQPTPLTNDKTNGL